MCAGIWWCLLCVEALTLILAPQGIRMAGSQLGVHLPVPLTLRRRGSIGSVFLMCYSQHLHHHHFHLLCRLIHFKKISDQWRSLNFNRFMPNNIKGHHLQLRCHPPSFHNFTFFNIKASMAHYPLIEKEVDYY